MAITAITPASGSSLEAGDSAAFTIDDTYTSLVIKVQTSTSLAVAYSTALGGGQAGYSVSVQDNGDGTHTVTYSSDAGWDIHPQLIYVVEDETGTEATTNLSYNIVGENPYPQGTFPYNSTSGPVVASFNTRTGVVVPEAGDYDAFYYTEAEVDAGLALYLALTGGEMSGNITMAGAETVDGRDLSADGTKLDLLTVTGAIDLDTNETLISANTAKVTNATHTGDVTGATALTIGALKVLEGMIAADAVTLAKMAAGTAGELVSYDASGDPVAVAVGTATHVLTSNGVGLPPTFQVAAGGGGDVTSDGTTAQDAVLLTERADHVNAPTAGFGELWAKNSSPCIPVFTKDNGADAFLLHTGAASETSRLAIFAGVEGQVSFDTDMGFLSATPNILYIDQPSSLRLGEHTAGCNVNAGQGAFWVKNTSPSEPWFKDDTGAEFSLVPGAAGDVVGPASATDNRIATFDTTSGKLIQDTAVAIEQTTGVITNVGTTAMLVLAETTGSFPTHSAGYGKLWIDNTAPTSLMYTDDVSSDHPVVMAPPGGVTDNRIVTWDGSTGSYVQSAAIAISDNGAITMTGSDNKLEMVERGSAPSNSATYGKFWVKNDAPNVPIFTDDAGTDRLLGTVIYIPYGMTLQTGALAGYHWTPDPESPWNPVGVAAHLGNGASPAITPYECALGTVTKDAILTEVQLWWRASVTTTDHDVMLWKCAWDSGLATYTVTQLGSSINIAGGTGATVRTDASVTFSSSNAVSKGDQIYLTLVPTGAAKNGTMYLQGGLHFEVTL